MDAATAIGSTWSATYDAAGNLTCRAPSSATTCAGTATGAQLTYDNEGQLAAWQNAPNSPTSTDSFLYDGEGRRVEQVATIGGTTTTTTYVGSLEEITTTGTTTTTASYGGLALSVNGTLSYTLSDGLGSVSEAVALDGSVTATQLYGPYGAVRYQSGTLPGTRGYTGQHADATTGLDYYNARYYDPMAGQFASADPLGSAGVYQMRYGQQAPFAHGATRSSARQPGTTTDTTAKSVTDTAAAMQRHAGSQAQVGDSVAGGATSGSSGSSGSSARPTPHRDGLNLYIYVKGNPTTNTDPTGMVTFGICVSLGGGAGAGGFGQVCVVGGVSAEGHLSGGVTQTAGGGGYGGSGGGLGIGVQASTANSVNDLSGWFGYAGGGGTFGIGADADGFAGRDQRNRAVYGVDIVASAGGDAHLTGGASYTNVTTFSDMWHGLRDPWNYSPIQSDGGAYARQVQDWVHQQIWSLIHQLPGWPSSR